MYKNNSTSRGGRKPIVAGSVVALLLFTFSLTSHAEARGRTKTKIHHSGIVRLDLVPGSERGAITFALNTGTIKRIGRPDETAYFVYSDASDDDFCDEYGCIPSRSLADTNEDALEDAEFDEDTGEWTFHNGAGFVTRSGPTGVIKPVPNPEYSPLKRIQWRGDTIIVNIPFVKWGDAPGETMLIDHGGRAPLIRSHQPNPFMFGDGPPGATDDEPAIKRYKGAQLLGLDIENLEVTIKLHSSVNKEGVLPHYVVWDANKGPAAGFMGTPFTPKTSNMGRMGETKAVGSVIQYANGVYQQGGGPNRFDKGLMSYTGGHKSKYTPMWHVTWLFYDMDGDGVFFDDTRNISRGAKPSPGSGIPGFDPKAQRSFNPFTMDDGGVSDPDIVAELTGGDFIGHGDVDDLVEAGVAIVTEGPPGLELNHPMQPPLIVNCPAPLTVKE